MLRATFGVAQTRAYISIVSAKISLPRDSIIRVSGGAIHINASAVLKNIGNTPASGINYFMKIDLADNKKSIFKTKFKTSQNGVIFGSIAHNEDTESSGYGIAISGNTELREVPSNIYCWVGVRCEYNDVFGNRWFTESSFEGRANNAKYTGISNQTTLFLSHRPFRDKAGQVKSAS